MLFFTSLMHFLSLIVAVRIQMPSIDMIFNMLKSIRFKYLIRLNIYSLYTSCIGNIDIDFLEEIIFVLFYIFSFNLVTSSNN